MFGGQITPTAITLATLEEHMGATTFSYRAVGGGAVTGLNNFFSGGVVQKGTRLHYDACSQSYRNNLTDYGSGRGIDGLFPGDATHAPIVGYWDTIVPWYCVYPHTDNTNTDAAFDVIDCVAYALDSVTGIWTKYGYDNGRVQAIPDRYIVASSSFDYVSAATKVFAHGCSYPVYKSYNGAEMYSLHQGAGRHIVASPSTVAAVVTQCKVRIVSTKSDGSFDGVVSYGAMAGVDVYPNGLSLNTSIPTWSGAGGNQIPLAGPGFVQSICSGKTKAITNDGQYHTFYAATIQGALYTTTNLVSYAGDRKVSDALYNSNPLIPVLLP